MKKLSICIATFNRAAFLSKTLSNLVPELTNECEIVVCDNASTDDTRSVVESHSRNCGQIRYIRHQTNRGLDRNFDSAVAAASGEYCWMFSDDDCITPGAIQRVLSALAAKDYSLVVVNAEVKDFEMATVLMPRSRPFETDKEYGPDQMNELFSALGSLVQFIGSFIVHRSMWLTRERERFYGSMFIHIGVLFQRPLPRGALVIADSLVSYRYGNRHDFSPRMFETYMVKLPDLVWSLELSDAAKRSVCPARPLESARALFFRRALGQYSIAEYKSIARPRLSSFHDRLRAAFVALCPGMLVNMAFSTYYAMHRNHHPGNRVLRYYMRGSPFHYTHWKQVRKARKSHVRPAPPEGDWTMSGRQG